MVVVVVGDDKPLEEDTRYDLGKLEVKGTVLMFDRWVPMVYKKTDAKDSSSK